LAFSRYIWRKAFSIKREVVQDFSCTEKPLIFFFLPAFVLIIAYSTIKLFKMLFLAREGMLAVQD
jgi:hypothetical protein